MAKEEKKKTAEIIREGECGSKKENKREEEIMKEIAENGNGRRVGECEKRRCRKMEGRESLKEEEGKGYGRREKSEKGREEGKWKKNGECEGGENTVEREVECEVKKEKRNGGTRRNERKIGRRRSIYVQG